ncbi:MAG: hypothetical protein WD176_09495 [Pirellulales bacterium]
MRPGVIHLRFLCGAIFGLAALSVALSAWAQSPPPVRFATPIATQPPPIIATPPGAPPGYWAAPPVTPAPYGAAPYGAPYGAAPYGSVPPPVYGAPGLDPRFSQGPNALVPGWSTPPVASPYCDPAPASTWAGCYRLITGASLEYTWLHGEDGRDLDINDFDASVTAALPIFPNPNHPLLVSPGFGFHLWQGPSLPEAGIADLPGNAYDAYIDFTWRPQLSELLAFELAFRPGVYSDFEQFNSDAFRLQGRGVAYLRVTPTLQLAAGAAYLDRLDIKLLPVGGFVWTPHERARYEVVFPKPKLARYMFTSWTNTEWWIYATGEYGGGSWSIERAAGFDDRIDINDIRVALGLEFKPSPAIDGARVFGRGFVAYLEGGYVFEREILYESGMPAEFELPDTFMVRGGLRF